MNFASLELLSLAIKGMTERFIGQVSLAEPALSTLPRQTLLSNKDWSNRPKQNHEQLWMDTDMPSYAKNYIGFPLSVTTALIATLKPQQVPN